MSILFNNVKKDINNISVIKETSFNINFGEVVALIGPNGSGKSTIFKLLATLLTPSAGNIKIDNIESQKERMKYLEQISFMQDSSVLYDYLTGYDHLKFIVKSRGIQLEELGKLIDFLNMDEFIHRKVKTYSLGMKQFLLLALSIINKPKVLILDEPFNGLDLLRTKELQQILSDLNNRGTTILFSSHSLGQIEKIAHKIFFIKHGTIIKDLDIRKEFDIYQLQIDNIENLNEFLKKHPNTIEIPPTKSNIYHEIITQENEFSADYIFGFFNTPINILKTKTREDVIEKIYTKYME